MANALQILSANLLCVVCTKDEATVFCICNLKQAVFCSSCSATHCQVPTTSPHLVLPIRFYEEARVPSRMKRLTAFAFCKEDFEGQNRDVLHWKERFTCEIDKLRKRLNSYQQSVETSFDSLHQCLSQSVGEGIQEVTANLDNPSPVFVSAVAEQLWSTQAHSTLLRCVTDFGQLFGELEERLSRTKVICRVECRGILREFEEGEIVLQREGSQHSQVAHTSPLESRLHACPWVFLSSFTVILLAAALCHSTASYDTVTYSNGDRYEGGRRRLASAEGAVCEGLWTDDHFTGCGQCWLSNGTNRIGQFKEGQLHGYGIQKEANSMFFGEFEEGQRRGIGVLYKSEREITVGNWTIEGLQGQGLELMLTEVRWGSYESGQLHGNATNIDMNGIRYEGGWRRGQKQGKGVEFYPAEHFTGLWNQDNIIPNGVYNYSDEYRLRYEKKTNARNRKRAKTSFELSASLLAECWLHMVGPVNNSEGVYEGQVSRQAQRHGYGVQRYAESGDLYEGSWRQGWRWGQGRLVLRAGQICEGMWERDEFTGWGSCVYANETSVKGQWQAGKLHGIAQIHAQNNVTMGEYEANRAHGMQLRYVSSAELAVSNWDQGVLSGHMLTLDKDSVQLSYYEAGESHEITSCPTAIAIERSLTVSPGWNVTRIQAEAITFQVSRAAYLLAVKVGSPYIKGTTAVIEDLQVLRGKSTAGRVIYSHNQLVQLSNKEGPVTWVKLHSWVELEPSVFYTIRMSYAIGAKVYYCEDLKNTIEQYGAHFQFENAVYENENVKGSNHIQESPLCGLSLLLDRHKH